MSKNAKVTSNITLLSLLTYVTFDTYSDKILVQLLSIVPRSIPIDCIPEIRSPCSELKAARMLRTPMEMGCKCANKAKQTCEQMETNE